ncbi:hypothetical protein ACWEQ4_01315 [Rhodococcus sp. NPDC003994]
MKITRIAAAGALTIGLAAGGAALTAAPAVAAPYCSSSVGCSGGETVDKGPDTPDGYGESIVKCVGNTALAATPGAGWAGRAALGAWGGWNSCDGLSG